MHKSGTFIVGFVETMYTVIEGDAGEVHVDVCVTLISPVGDIGDERILVDVFNDTTPKNIPLGSALASKLLYYVPYGHYMYSVDNSSLTYHEDHSLFC